MKRTPLKRKTTLKVKTSLKVKTPLTAKKSMNRAVAAKPGKTSHASQKVKPYKPSYPYRSVFTNDLSVCIITGTDKAHGSIHVHHIFGGANKANSEKYGFLIPLRADWHDMADYGIHFDRALDLKFKRRCQEYWLEHYGTRDEFIKVFGQWW